MLSEPASAIAELAEQEQADLIVPFKRDVYLRVLDAFGGRL